MSTITFKDLEGLPIEMLEFKRDKLRGEINTTNYRRNRLKREIIHLQKEKLLMEQKNETVTKFKSGPKQVGKRVDVENGY